MSDIVQGKVYSIVFNQGDYYITTFEALGQSRPIKAKGSIYGLVQLRPGISLRLVGKWTTHPKYGREFSFQSWEPWVESTREAVAFLSVCVQGFADLRVVDALVERYGMEVFNWLTHKRSEIQAQPFEGVSQESIERVLLSWERALAHRDLSRLLKAGGLSVTDIQAAMTQFGTEASKIITENPFRLMEIPSFSFGKTDRLATHLGVKKDDPRRVQGAAMWALQEGSRQGHLFMRRGELHSIIIDIVHQEKLEELPSVNLDQAVLELLRQKSVVHATGSGIYLPYYHLYEQKSAEILSRQLLDTDLKVDLNPFLESYEKSNRIQLSPTQRRALELLLAHRVLVITGLPGTGKTTVLRAIVRLLEEAKQSIALMAPTGIAAKRLASVTGHNASTVHRALRHDGTDWGHHENNRYLVDTVILDEASMMDQELFYRLLVALRPETRIILVGDDAQLPSVGPGNVLRELIDCDKVPHVRLTEIFRQALKGEIVQNSHAIHSGRLPDMVSQDKDSEFRFIRSSDEAHIVDLIVAMAVKLKSRNANFQVLSPKYDGTVGVTNLNERLRDALNPAGPTGPMEWVWGAQRFRNGDRLMVIQNDYEYDIYNGDVGKLTSIKDREKELEVRIHGIGDGGDRTVTFPYELAENKLRLAYAITVHKSQGSEFDTIIMPIVKSQGRMLQRNLLYTAVTRARKRVWLIGEEFAVQKAVENNKVVRRNTNLSKAISACLAAGVPPEAVNGVLDEARTD